LKCSGKKCDLRHYFKLQNIQFGRKNTEICMTKCEILYKKKNRLTNVNKTQCATLLIRVERRRRATLEHF